MYTTFVPTSQASAAGNRPKDLRISAACRRVRATRHYVVVRSHEILEMRCYVTCPIRLSPLYALATGSFTLYMLIHARAYLFTGKAIPGRAQPLSLTSNQSQTCPWTTSHSFTHSFTSLLCNLLTRSLTSLVIAFTKLVPMHW